MAAARKGAAVLDERLLAPVSSPSALPGQAGAAVPDERLLLAHPHYPLVSKIRQCNGA